MEKTQSNQLEPSLLRASLKHTSCKRWLRSKVISFIVVVGTPRNWSCR